MLFSVAGYARADTPYDLPTMLNKQRRNCGTSSRALASGFYIIVNGLMAYGGWPLKSCLRIQICLRYYGAVFTRHWPYNIRHSPACTMHAWKLGWSLPPSWEQMQTWLLHHFSLLAYIIFKKSAVSFCVIKLNKLYTYNSFFSYFWFKKIATIVSFRLFVLIQHLTNLILKNLCIN